MIVPSWTKKNLEEKHEFGNYRKLKSFSVSPNHNFGSNDYLALSRHPEILLESRSTENIGACASRLLATNYSESLILEEELADYFGFESSLLFSSGFITNLGLISTLVRREDVVFSDKLIHASLLEGIRLANCKHFRFQHNDIEHLESFLNRELIKRKNGQNFYIIVESLYSMTGDMPDFSALSELSKKHNCILIIDEAHAVGVYEKGLSKNINKDNLIITGTFSKAFGTYGGFVCGANWLKELLVNNCKTFIYNTTLPQLLIKASRKSLKIIKDDPGLGKTLISNSNYFRENLALQSYGVGQIVSLPIGSSEKALELSEKLSSHGFLVPAIRPPTVTEAILRISLTLHHDKEILSELAMKIRAML